MTKIFLTGDRSMDQMTSLVATMAALNGLVEEFGLLPEIATGDSLTGIESAVRFVLPGVRVFKSDMGSDGKPDLDARHAEAAVLFDRVLVVHTEPFESSIYRSAIKSWDDSALTVFP